MKYKNGSNIAAKANNPRCLRSTFSFNLKMKSIAVKKIVATTKRKNIVAVGLRLRYTWVDQMNDNPQIIMAITPAI